MVCYIRIRIGVRYLQNISNISLIGLKGLQGYKVMVEVELLHGTDSVVIVGLPDATIKESRRWINEEDIVSVTK